MDIRLISNDSESSEGDKVTTNKLPSWIWHCPIKYNHLHARHVCVHLTNSHVATELSRVQPGLHGQGEEKARTISYLVISPTQTVKPTLVI